MTGLHNSMYYLLAGSFLFGSIIGSFLNVCIYRIPAGENIVSPRSRCPQCHELIRWYQNLPILSWLVLGRKCAFCQTSISSRYPFVEALTGVLFAAMVYRVLVDLPLVPNPWLLILAFWVLVSALVAITFIDIDHQIIPDVISLPGILVGFACSFAIPWVSWLDSLSGILLGGGSLYLIAAGYELLTKKEGMGGGDIKFLAMLGAFLGWKSVLPIIFLGSLAGTLIGVPLMIWKGADGKLAIPFGPFLSLGTLIYLFAWPEIKSWYFSFFLV